MTSESEKDAARSHAEEALRRKRDIIAHRNPYPGQSAPPQKSAIKASKTAAKDPALSRDALDEPSRKRSHTPRTGDG